MYVCTCACVNVEGKWPRSSSHEAGLCHLSQAVIFKKNAVIRVNLKSESRARWQQDGHKVGGPRYGNQVQFKNARRAVCILSGGFCQFLIFFIGQLRGAMGRSRRRAGLNADAMEHTAAFLMESGMAEMTEQEKRDASIHGHRQNNGA